MEREAACPAKPWRSRVPSRRRFFSAIQCLEGPPDGRGGCGPHGGGPSIAASWRDDFRVVRSIRNHPGRILFSRSGRSPTLQEEQKAFCPRFRWRDGLCPVRLSRPVSARAPRSRTTRRSSLHPCILEDGLATLQSQRRLPSLRSTSRRDRLTLILSHVLSCGVMPSLSAGERGGRHGRNVQRITALAHWREKPKC
jgi:hypothetical protein